MSNFNSFANWAKTRDPNKIDWGKVKQDFPKIDVDAFITNEMSTPYDQTVKPKGEFSRLVEGLKELPKVALSIPAYLSGAEAIGESKGNYPLPKLADVAKSVTDESVKNAKQWIDMADPNLATKIPAMVKFGQQLKDEPITTGLRVAGLAGGGLVLAGMAGKMATLGQVANEAINASNVSRKATKLTNMAGDFKNMASEIGSLGGEETSIDMIMNQLDYATLPNKTKKSISRNTWNSMAAVDKFKFRGFDDAEAVKYAELAPKSEITATRVTKIAKDIYPESPMSKLGLADELRARADIAAELEKVRMSRQQKKMPDGSIITGTKALMSLGKEMTPAEKSAKAIDELLTVKENLLSQNRTPAAKEAIIKEINAQQDMMTGSSVPTEQSVFELPKELLGNQSGQIRIPKFYDPTGSLTSRFKNHPAFQGFVQMMNKSEDYHAQIHGPATSAWEDLSHRPKKATKIAIAPVQGHSYMTNYENGLTQATPQLEQVAKTQKQILNELAQKAKALGAKGSEWDNPKHMPHMALPKTMDVLQSADGDVWDALVKHYQKIGVDEEQLKKVISQNIIKNNSPNMPNPEYNNFKVRDLNLPEYVEVKGRGRVYLLNTNPYEVMPKYIDYSTKRLAIVSQFGWNDDIINDVIKAARADKVVQEHIKGVWKIANGIRGNELPAVSPAVKTAFDLAHSAVSDMMLSHASIPNAFGLAPGFEKFRIIDGLRAMKDAIAYKFGNLDAAEKIRMVRMNDMATKNAMAGLAMTQDMSIRPLTTATGMNFMNRVTNTVTPIHAMYSMEHGLTLIREGKEGILRRLVGGDGSTYIRQLKRDFDFTDADIAFAKANGFSEDMKTRIIRRTPALVNSFKLSPLDTPLWLQHPLPRKILAFTSFHRAMGRVFKSAVAEARHGNAMPLAKFVGGQIAVGEGSMGVLNLIRNRTRTDEGAERLFNDVMQSASFGLWGVMGQDLAFNLKHGELPSEMLIPPQIKAGTKMVVGMAKAGVKLDAGEAGKTLVQTIPLVKDVAMAAQNIFNHTESERQEKLQMKKEYKARIVSAMKDNDNEEIGELRSRAFDHEVVITNTELREWRDTIKATTKRANKPENFWQKVGVSK